MTHNVRGRARKQLLLVLALAVCTGVSACKRSSEELGKNVKTYTLRGKVMGTDPSTGEVTLAHEAVPGFMEAMTMPYKLADRNTISELHTGDRINARLRVQQDSDGEVHNALLDEVVITSQERPDTKPAVTYHVPTAGDAVPDFHLTDQSGRPVHLAQFQGKAVLLTFIYTRCPLSDFCPRMSRNFAKIDALLQKDAAAYRKTHLLSISFDPAYDTPAVLRSYGEAYTGRYTAERFEHWTFAAPAKADLPKLEQYFNVGVTPGENASLTHSLSTVLIDPAGKVAAWYPTNEWKPEEVAQRMRDLSAAAK